MRPGAAEGACGRTRTESAASPNDDWSYARSGFYRGRRETEAAHSLTRGLGLEMARKGRGAGPDERVLTCRPSPNACT